MDPDAVDGAGRWLAVAALRGRWFVAEPACEDAAVGCAISGCPPTHASGSCILLVPWTVRSKRPANALRRLRIDRASGVICLGSLLSTCLRASTPATTGHPTAASAPSASQGDLETRSARVVSHHLGGLLRAQPRIESGACSMNEGASVLQPAADQGSPRFRAGRLDRWTLPSATEGGPPLPRDAHTPRRCSRQQPYRVTTTAASVLVPPSP